MSLGKALFIREFCGPEKIRGRDAPAPLANSAKSWWKLGTESMVYGIAALHDLRRRARRRLQMHMASGVVLL